ncbi:MAG: LegC family aminotransferase [Chthoniobacterales bacterium]|nr:LegC family aminotransferase [Chthoniobacterales bacterium]
MSFEPGAPAQAGFIPLSVPEIQGNELSYIKECLDTGWVSSVGAYVDRFEQSLAARAGTKYAVATVNGTAALHIALLVAGIEPDDEVLLPTITFIAPANAVRYCGAWPVFIDAEPDYWQMDPNRVVDFLETKCQWHEGVLRNRRSGRRVRAILPVHILGHPVDLDPILEVARKFGLAVIEDATESLGAKYRERSVGSLGDIACFSFNGNKIITTGGGGMIVTDNEAWAQRAKFLTNQAKEDPVEYVHHEIGFNYRLTNVLAALGCAQLEQLDAFIARKRAIAASYAAALHDVPGIRPMREASWASSIFWLFTIVIDPQRYGQTSRELLDRLAQNEIQARPLWQPMHRSIAHAEAEFTGGETADFLHRDCLSLPCSVGLTGRDLERVCAIIAGR